MLLCCWWCLRPETVELERRVERVLSAEAIQPDQWDRALHCTQRCAAAAAAAAAATAATAAVATYATQALGFHCIVSDAKATCCAKFQLCREMQFTAAYMC